MKLLPPDLYEFTIEDKKHFEQEWALGIVRPDDPVLARAARVVDPKLIRTPPVQELVKRLLAVAGQQQKPKRQGAEKRLLVGLAAPQIGESWRIAVVDTRATADRKRAGQLVCFINPEIMWRSHETEEGREGCFSAGPVWGLVRRPVAVKIKAFTTEGEKIERIFEGFTARIIQHEIDHLSGIHFPDRIKSDRKRHWVHTEELPFYPENIYHWPRICTKERWEAYVGPTNRVV